MSTKINDLGFLFLFTLKYVFKYYFLVDFKTHSLLIVTRIRFILNLILYFKEKFLSTMFCL